MYSNSNFHVFAPQAQENSNALMARKPGTLNSPRKPLGDRTVNKSNLLKPEPVKPKVLNKPSLSARKATPKKDEFSWIPPAYSFKEVEDTYEDILPKSERLQPSDFINKLYPKTPPFKEKIEIDPMFMELPEVTIFRFPDETEELEKLPIEDPEFPDFDFLDDADF